MKHFKVKRMTSIILATVLLLGILPTGIIGVSAEPIAPIEPDTAWYTDAPEASAFNIGTAAELLGLAKIANEDVSAFNGKTINLTNDIDLNSGWVASAETEPANVWTPMSISGAIIDGQSHSISGLYVSGERQAAFCATADNTTIKNLAVLNSYFNSTGENDDVNGAAAIVDKVTSEGSCTFENIYTNAIVKGVKNVGGIVGWSSGGAITVTDCVFAGSVSLDKKYGGGIVGNGNGKNVAITGCVNLGTISGMEEVGGILGRNGGTTTIDSCVNFGKIYSTTSNNYEGDIVGRHKGGTLTITNCFYTDGAGKQRAAGNGTACNVGTQTNVEMKADKAAVAAAVLADSTSFANWTVLSSTYVEPVYVPSKIAAMFSNIYIQENKAENKIRFIGVLMVDDLQLCDKVGFKISVNYSGLADGPKVANITTSTVYKSVLADGVTACANNFGGNYFYVLEITNLDTAGADVEFEVTAVIENNTAISEVGTEISYTYSVANNG